MNFIEKIKKSFNKKTIALGLVGSLIVGSGFAYGFFKAKKIKESHFDLSNSVSFEDAINDISKTSKIDEIIVDEELVKLNKSKETLENVLSVYKENRVNENLYMLNNKITELGLLTLKSSILNTLNIKPCDVIELLITSNNNCYIKYNKEVKKLVPGNIQDVDIEKVEKKITLSGQAEEILKVIYESQAHAYNEEEIDNAYKTIIKFLYTKSEINENYILNDKITFKYDQELIKKLKR